MLPQCSHITKKRGVYYYRRRIPTSPNGEIVLSLRTRVFRVAECLADGLDREFRRLLQEVTTDDKTNLPAILRTYLKQRLDRDMWRRVETPNAPMFASPVPGKSHASVDLEWIEHELATARGELASRAYIRHYGLFASGTRDRPTKPDTPSTAPKEAVNAPRQQTASAEIPIASDAQLRHLPRFPWRFANAGPRVRGAVIMGRRSKTFTGAVVRYPLISRIEPSVKSASSTPIGAHIRPVRGRSSAPSCARRDHG
jgi:hypothetical protein